MTFTTTEKAIRFIKFQKFDRFCIRSKRSISQNRCSEVFRYSSHFLYLTYQQNCFEKL